MPWYYLYHEKTGQLLSEASELAPGDPARGVTDAVLHEHPELLTEEDRRKLAPRDPGPVVPTHVRIFVREARARPDEQWDAGARAFVPRPPPPDRAATVLAGLAVRPILEAKLTPEEREALRLELSRVLDGS